MFDKHTEAELLNDYYSSVFTIDNRVNNKAGLPKSVTVSMPPIFFTPDQVLKCRLHNYSHWLIVNGKPWELVMFDPHRIDIT